LRPQSHVVAALSAAIAAPPGSQDRETRELAGRAGDREIGAIPGRRPASCPAWEGSDDGGVSVPPRTHCIITNFICNFFIAIATGACYNSEHEIRLR
jgi:hypothetical protein